MLNNSSPWLLECLKKIKNKKNKFALDLACGSGRNSYILAEQGYKVLALDNDKKQLSKIVNKKINAKKVNVEKISNWPLAKNKFDLIIIFNFLYRPIFPYIISSLNINGHLVYETFAKGHSKFGPPSNQDYLLDNKELIKLTIPLSLIAYEDIMVKNHIKSFKKQRVFLKNV